MIDITAIETKVSTQEFTERALAYKWVLKYILFFLYLTNLNFNLYIYKVTAIYFKIYSVYDSSVYLNVLQNVYYKIRLLKKYSNLVYNFLYNF